MATKIMPKKKETAEEIAPKVGQGRPVLGRFRLQVDHQTKSAFESSEEAEAIGVAIKKAHPIVQVSVYDAEMSVQKVLD